MLFGCKYSPPLEGCPAGVGWLKWRRTQVVNFPGHSGARCQKVLIEEPLKIAKHALDKPTVDH
jgi:hypothetical protein